MVGIGPYRGLLPHQPLIYSSRGDGMSQNTKRRVLETGEEKAYRACDSLQAHVTQLYQRAGIKGGSSHSGRRTFDSKVLPPRATWRRWRSFWALLHRLLAALCGC